MLPRRRLLIALLGAGLLILITLLSPLVWIAVALYLAVLLALVLQEAVTLPRARDFAALRDVPHPLSLGAQQTVAVVLGNPNAALMPALVADHAPADLRPGARVLAGRFDAQGELVVRYQTRPPRRGAYQFGPVDLRCWRPRGWLIRQVRIPAPEQAAVYPDVLQVRRYNLLLRRGVRVSTGLRRARPPGASTAFAGLREYLPGDDVRRIGWKATARRDSPVTVEVEAERGQQAVIAIDCGRLMTAAAGDLRKLDHAVNAALLLAYVAERMGDRVGMLTFSDRVGRFLPPRRGAHQLSEINQLLYDVQPDYAEPDFAEAFTYLALRISRRSLVVVLTDVLDPQASSDLTAHAVRLAARHLVLVVAMADSEILEARRRPIDRVSRGYEWAAAEELLTARRQSFETLQRGGVLGLDVPAGRLSPALVERYLELKERALL
jgi:uncharacterized protein (DUF58 family)